jgi:formate dehydrogenase alpha subunit
VAGLAAAFGSGAMTNSIEEIENADCIFIIGSNTSVAHPLIATRVFRAKAKGAKLIVADPRRIPIILQSDLHLQQNLGTDVALINGLMHIILKNGWQDQAFIDERTENFEELKKLVENYPPERVSEITGIPVAGLEKAAEYYAKAERGSILYTMGITQHTTGVDNVLARNPRASIPCEGRTMFKALVTWVGCRMYIRVTRQWSIKRFDRNLRRPGELNFQIKLD